MFVYSARVGEGFPIRSNILAVGELRVQHLDDINWRDACMGYIILLPTASRSRETLMTEGQVSRCHPISPTAHYSDSP